MTPSPVPIQRLGHIESGIEQFEGSVGGLRSYLESIRSNDPQLYIRLDPALGRLEAKRNTAMAILVGGLALGAAATIYAFAGTKDCSAVVVANGEGHEAWSQCNDDNLDKAATFTLIGAGSVAAGLVAWFVIKPSRSDLLDFVNDHNRVSPTPLRWDLGYDPVHQVAYTRAALHF